MISLNEADLHPFEIFDINSNPLYRENNLINRQNSFPLSSSSYNEQEEENHLYDFYSLSNGLGCFNNIEEKKSILIGYPSSSKISSQIKDKPKEKNINLFDNNYTKTLFSSNKDELSLLEDKEKDPFDLFPPNKFKKIFDIKKKPIFEVKSPKRNNLFSFEKINSDSNIEDDKKIFLGKKRKSRKNNSDNIRTKIKRHYFNTALIGLLNEMLSSIWSGDKDKDSIFIFPDHLVRDVQKERNQKLFDMTLLELFEKKELYILEKNDFEKNQNIMESYKYNLKIIHSDKVKDCETFKKILNKKISDLYQDYLNSAQFKIVEINRLKKKNFCDDYINRYKYLAKNLIRFFNNEK